MENYINILQVMNKLVSSIKGAWLKVIVFIRTITLCLKKKSSGKLLLCIHALDWNSLKTTNYNKT